MEIEKKSGDYMIIWKEIVTPFYLYDGVIEINFVVRAFKMVNGEFNS